MPMIDKINKLLLTTFLTFFLTDFFAESLNDQIAGLKEDITALEQIDHSMLLDELISIQERLTALERTKSFGPGFPSLPFVDSYSKTGTCSAITVQPLNVCLVTGTCYNTSLFLDLSSLNLQGQVLTAVKSTPDATNKDGGIWMCDSGNLSTLSAIAQCTNIGGNRKDGSDTVEFVIPVGADNKRIYALSMNSSGVLATNSALTNVSVCLNNNSLFTP